MKARYMRTFEVASQQLIAANCFHRVRGLEKYHEERLAYVARRRLRILFETALLTNSSAGWPQ
jgi:hypothetical protein